MILSEQHSAYRIVTGNRCFEEVTARAREKPRDCGMGVIQLRLSATWNRQSGAEFTPYVIKRLGV